MYKLTPLLVLFYPIHSYAKLSFKKELVTQGYWFSSSMAVLILGGVAWFVAQYLTRKKTTMPKNPLIKVITLNHQCKAYVVEYQEQRFLIADNRQAIAIHELASRGNSERN